MRTGAGDDFDPAAVRWVRFAAELPSLHERLLAGGMLPGSSFQRSSV
jgi:hypothetical protein